jgi:hypothetical protein
MEDSKTTEFEMEDFGQPYHDALLEAAKISLYTHYCPIQC